ncbi:hypothetical protein TVAG_210860 [Trichomonas vaginalis G3]|uniref:Uncharacterized protein n=1 Tax=Trichomonas vaginalis (strain ATCC PRA-98 / G3) TaxID=412133 RepID=A2F872_TRIV3|nr:hypothetical protein TVAGG3_0736670 [Trichomonas vaginalis G3]EAX98892.1 hypothetical protein TVAG_210860 [Trichomonas vaginalis G3]KAI5511628.1 hypothetical protein TVAGG3_0736670 [Trichomonas vaginalis G3]|eukprot:XP_001311822.1 hypothetical protein [Trichomonas vaginalis G3]
MENGSSELSIHEQDIHNSDDSKENNFDSQNSLESLSTFITSLQQLQEEIEYKINIVQDAIKELESFKDYKETPGESEFETAFDDADQKKPDFELVDKVLNEFIDNISDIKQLLLYIDDQIQVSHIQLKQKKKRLSEANNINLDSDTTSELYRDENNPKTKKNTEIKNKIKEDGESALAARQQINQLVDEINQLQYNGEISQPIGDDSQEHIQESEEDIKKEQIIDQNLQNYYEAEISRYKRILNIQQKEVEEMTQVRNECEQSIEEFETEKRKNIEELNTKTTEISDLKMEMNNCIRAITEIKKISPQLAAFNAHITSVVEDMEKINNGVKSQLEKLTLEYQNYQEIVDSYNKAQEIIKQNRLHQDDVIQKLIEATDLSDKTLEEIHRYKVEKDGYSDDLQNINKIIEDVTQKLDKQVEEIDKSAKDYYSTALYKLSSRINEAKAENSNLIREKEFLLTEIQDSNNKYQTLKESTGQKSRDEYLSEIFEFNKKCQEIIQKLIGLHQENINTKKRIEKLNEQKGSTDNQTYINILNSRAQQIKMAINQICSNIGDIESQNQSNNEINIQLKKHLEQKTQEVKNIKQNATEEKESQIKKSKQELEKIISLQQQEIVSMQSKIEEFRKQSKTAKNNSEKMSKETQEKLNTIDAQLSNMAKTRKKLESRHIELIDYLNKSSYSLQDVTSEINTLQIRIAKKNSHEKRRAEQITQMEVQRLSMESEIKKAKMLSARLDEEIASQQEKNNQIDIRLIENNES